MYEHIRANLAKDIAAAQQGVTDAINHRDQVQALLNAQQLELPGLQSAVDAAQGTLNARNADLANAQAVVNQRTAERDSAEADRDSAQQAFDANGGDEPPFFDNPDDLRRWQQLHDALKQALREAQDALDAAEAQLQATIPPRDAAAVAVQNATALLNQARGRVDAQNAAIAASQQQLAAAETAITAARAAVDALKVQVTALDQREATLTASPLDRPKMEAAADLEETDLQTGWHHRRDLFERRVQFRQNRAGILAAHDVTVDELAVLRSHIAGSPEAASFPGLATVISGIDSIIADNAAQRTKPPLQRTDDLDGIHNRLAALVGPAQDVVGQATSARNSAANDLADVRQRLIDHEQEAP